MNPKKAILPAVILFTAALASPTFAAPGVVVQKQGDGTVVSWQPYGIVCSTGCPVTSKTYAVGTTVQLMAEPGVGARFDHWEGTCTGTNPLCTITVSALHLTKAVFTPVTGLPACPVLNATSQIYGVFPVMPANLTGVTPVGEVDATGHTFPNWHMFATVNPTPTPVGYDPVYSPVTGKVISVMRTRGSPAEMWDYYIRFANCAEVEIMVAIVNNVDPAWEAAFGFSAAPSGNILERSDPAALWINEGTYLGLVNLNKRKIALEAYDKRKPTAAFYDLGRYRAIHAYLQCPIDYFTTPIQTAVNLHLPGAACGRADQDVPGALQGNWFFYGDGNLNGDAVRSLDQKAHIAFVKNATGTRLISMANTTLRAGVIMPPSPIYTVNAAEPAFHLVTPASGLVCYTLAGAGGADTNRSLLVKMDNNTILRTKISTTACAALGAATIESAAPADNPIVRFSR
ncbi:MAG: hypothetical protein J0L53_15315 [Spirochaetes bacterium]|nr:hypothetical protein [Spirochaetota bacterium]